MRLPSRRPSRPDRRGRTVAETPGIARTTAASGAGDSGRSTWVVFFISGAVLATWSADIPGIRDRLGLSTGAMSAVILMLGLATVAAGLYAGQLLTRFSTARMSEIGVVLTPLSGIAAIVAPSPLSLVVALLILGTTYGVLDIGMNAHGVAIEKRIETVIMSTLHGGWSIGGLVGAGAVAIVGLLKIDSRVEGIVVLGLLVVVGAWFGRRLAVEDGGRASGDGERGAKLMLPTRGLMLIGLLAAISFAIEGVVIDWSSLFVVQETSGGTALGAAAVAVFSGGMAAGRLPGDMANRLFGPPTLLRLGYLGSAVSLLALAATGAAWLVLPAVFVAGLASANGAPLLLSAAGRSKDLPIGAAIGAATTMGNLGLLVIPPLLGAAAQFSSLSVTFALTGGLAVIGAVTTRAALA